MGGEVLRRNLGKIVRRQVGFTLDSLRHIREPAARARLRGQIVGLLTWPRMLPARRRVLGPGSRKNELIQWIGKATW